MVDIKIERVYDGDMFDGMFESPVPDGAAEVFGTIRECLAELQCLNTSRWSNQERFAFLRQVEDIWRALPALSHTVVNQLGEQGAAAECGGVNLRDVLAQGLSISLSEAGERIRTAQDLGARTQINGEVVAPRLAEAARAQASGLISPEHVRVLREFDQHVLNKVDPELKERANQDLVEFAARLRPDQLRPLSVRLLSCLDPDGSLEDERDRRRKSFVRLGVQGVDKMSTLTGLIDPEARAYLEVVFAKLAAPGVLNPDGSGQGAEASGAPESYAEAEHRDGRSLGQRQHDALKFLARRFADGKTSIEDVQEALQKGVPVVVNATVTLRELHNAAGLAYTAGQTALPIRDLIRMAAKAISYLTVFDDNYEVPLYLGRSKRTASLGQRIALAATEGGCRQERRPGAPPGKAAATRQYRPGCTSPPNYCAEFVCAHALPASGSLRLARGHHVTEWSSGGGTDLDNLTLTCPAHHKLVGPGPRHWHTVKPPGEPTHWHPPEITRWLRRWANAA